MVSDEMRNTYVNKLSKHSEGIENILSITEEANILNYNTIQQLEKIKNEIERIKKQLKYNEYIVSLIGLDKAGKSTIANAIIENNILPSMPERCTYTPTKIKYGNKTRARVSFLSADEFNVNFQIQLDDAGIPADENATFHNLSKMEFNRLYDVAKIDARNKINEMPESFVQSKALKELEAKYKNIDITTKNDIINILDNKDSIVSFLDKPERVFEGNEVESDELKQFITSKKFAPAVRFVEIESELLSEMQNITLYDMPGIDSPTQIHLEQTIEKMKESDIVILATDLRRPSLTSPVIKILKDCEDEYQVNLKDKLFIFANNTDLCGSTAVMIKEEYVNVLVNDLIHHQLLDPQNKDRVLFGSAKAHLQLCGKIEGTDVLDAMNNLGFPPNIPELKQKLEYYNKYIRFGVVKKRVNKIFNDIQDLFSDMKDRYENKDRYDNKKEDFMAMSYYDSTKKQIRQNLENYRIKIRTSTANKTLEKAFGDLVNSYITVEKCGVNEKDIIAAEASVNISINNDISASTADIVLREQKFKKIYNGFIRMFYQITKDEEKRIIAEINSEFLNGLGIDNTQYLTEIADSIKKYLSNFIDNSNSGGYYISLVERFCIDLFELFILYPYASKLRSEKFELNKDDFNSLRMFYKNVYGTVTDESAFRSLMLTQTSSDVSQEQMSEALKIISTCTSSSVPLTGAMKSRLEKYLSENANGCDRLQNAFSTFPKNTVNKEKEIEKRLIELEETTISDGVFAKIKLEFDNDIKKLNHMLINAAVSAINIDKAFYAKIIRYINNMISSLSAESVDEAIFSENVEKSFKNADHLFTDFMSGNVRMIKHKEYTEIEERKRRLLYQEQFEIQIINVLDNLK